MPIPGLVVLEGLSLKQVQELALIASWERHGGNVERMCRELKVSRRALMRRLKAYGLTKIERRPHRVTDVEIASVFRQHRRLICDELDCKDAQFISWLNRTAPFLPDDF
jgi:hypothetical protein